MFTERYPLELEFLRRVFGRYLPFTVPSDGWSDFQGTFSNHDIAVMLKVGPLKKIDWIS